MACTAALPFLGLALPAQAEPVDLESGAHALVEAISTRMKASQVKKVAVLPFPDLNGYPSALGDFLAEELVTHLFMVSPEDFSVVERSQLERVLKEQELTASGLFDSKSIATVGKILGIDAIVTGSITYLGDQIKINARVVSVESAKIFAAAAVKVPQDSVAEALMHQRSGTSPSALGGGRRPAQVQRHDVFFQNDFLRIDVRSIGLSANRKTATLALDFQNLVSEELLLAVERDHSFATGNGKLRLIDDHGQSLEPIPQPEGVVGLASLYLESTNGFRVRRESRRPPTYSRETFTTLAPGSRTTVIVTFTASREEFGGSLFSFGGNLVRLVGGSLKRFSIGIANIESLSSGTERGKE